MKSMKKFFFQKIIWESVFKTFFSFSLTFEASHRFSHLICSFRFILKLFLSCFAHNPKRMELMYKPRLYNPFEHILLQLCALSTVYTQVHGMNLICGVSLTPTSPNRAKPLPFKNPTHTHTPTPSLLHPPPHTYAL